MNTKEQLMKETISGIAWSFVTRIANLLIQFMLVAVLAHLLDPKDFATIGLLTVFSLISESIVDSGFSQTLIRCQTLDEKTLSSVFYFNVLIGLILYTLLFFCAPIIADFYQIPELISISRFVFLTIIIHALSIIPNTILLLQMKFKSFTKISVPALFVSAIFGIAAAYYGFGVYSIVVQMLSYSTLNVCLMYYTVQWHPSLLFSWKDIKSLLPFSLNLMAVGLITVIFNNIYTLIIGKVYPAQQLGYYTQAKKVEELPSQSITTIIQKVSYSSLSKVGGDVKLLKQAYSKIIFQNLYIVLPIMGIISASCDNFIPLMFGEKWLPMIPLLRILCIYGAIFPLFSINGNILKVLGLGRKFLKQEIVRRILMVLSILLTIHLGLAFLLWGWVISMLLSIIYSFYLCGKPLNYSVGSQVRDVLPYFLVAIVIGLATYAITFTTLSHLVQMAIQILCYVVLYLIASIVFHLDAFQDILKLKRLFLNKL